MSISAAILVLATLAAFGRPAADPLDRVLNGPASTTAIYQANGALQGCGARACLAVHDLALAFKAIERRDLPNTMARTTPAAADPEREADRVIARTLLAHPDRYGDDCRILAKLAHHYEAWSVGQTVIELANRVDGPGDRCTAQVLAAFPAGPKTRKLIAASRDTCQAAGRRSCKRDTP